MRLSRQFCYSSRSDIAVWSVLFSGSVHLQRFSLSLEHEEKVVHLSARIKSFGRQTPASDILSFYPGAFVDTAGNYWDVPFPMAIDLASFSEPHSGVEWKNLDTWHYCNHWVWRYLARAEIDDRRLGSARFFLQASGIKSSFLADIFALIYFTTNMDNFCFSNKCLRDFWLVFGLTKEVARYCLKCQEFMAELHFYKTFVLLNFYADGSLTILSIKPCVFDFCELQNIPHVQLSLMSVRKAFLAENVQSPPHKEKGRLENEQRMEKKEKDAHERRDSNGNYKVNVRGFQ
ncbi:hypothetical protein VNO78_03076 [Psophocarpus tetragonolobus]|uniref:Uncharacterized protein n=1 Tax=Psophocarpus tetragonolobus TaxID=3891 RepID=A0AAN9TCI2_PSOTE